MDKLSNAFIDHSFWINWFIHAVKRMLSSISNNLLEMSVLKIIKYIKPVNNYVINRLCCYSFIYLINKLIEFFSSNLFRSYIF